MLKYKKKIKKMDKKTLKIKETNVFKISMHFKREKKAKKKKPKMLLVLVVFGYYQTLFSI